MTQSLNVTKHLRQLESSDIRLNEIDVVLNCDRPAPPVDPRRATTRFVDSVTTLIALDRAVIPFPDYLLQLPVSDRHLARQIFAAIETGGVFGVASELISVRSA